MRSRSADPGGRAVRGSVTAETALALPALALVLAGVLATGRVLLAQVSCVDAARAGARAAARAEADPQVRALVTSLAPPGSLVGIRRAEGLVHVEVVASVQLPVPGPAVPLRCLAASRSETP